jgi:hypothetical protein
MPVRISVPDFYETLAYHYSQSNNFQKAYEYLKLSGDKAARNYANQEAIRFYREAIQALDALPECQENKKEKLEELDLGDVAVDLRKKKNGLLPGLSGPIWVSWRIWATWSSVMGGLSSRDNLSGVLESTI